MRLRLAAFSACLSLAAGLRAQTVTVDTLTWNGPTANRINLVFLGDGYTPKELDRFSDWAKAAFDSLFLEAKNPTRFYIDHKSMFNAFAVRTPSNQSGVTHPGKVTRDTYYGCSFEGDWTTGNCNRSQALKTAAKYLPEYTTLIMVFNDQGGLRATGGEPIYMPEGDYIHVVKHELGHSLGDLEDEYVEDGRTKVCPETPNTTAETRREALKWNRWVLAATAIPTPAGTAGVTGLFEGAGYMSHGCYRPQADCIMHSYTGYDQGKLVQFCRVCGEEMILQAYQRVRPVDSAFPPAGAVTMQTLERREFRVKPLAVATIAVDWFLDGKAVVSATPGRLTLGDLAAGDHKLAALVRDTTPEVRKNKGLLADTVAWTIHVAPITGTVAARGSVAGYAIAGDRLSLDLPGPGLVTLRGLDPLGRTVGMPADGEAAPAGRTVWKLPKGVRMLSVTVSSGNGAFAPYHRVIPLSPGP
ncbi:MAG TPA: M64 family metallopeptidase [Fibrobacteria bacterium]|nr:M64 family metallopeptidase [Fibrobacteria bacterium]